MSDDTGIVTIVIEVDDAAAYANGRMWDWLNETTEGRVRTAALGDHLLARSAVRSAAAAVENALALLRALDPLDVKCSAQRGGTLKSDAETPRSALSIEAQRRVDSLSAAELHALRLRHPSASITICDGCRLTPGAMREETLCAPCLSLLHS